MSAVAAVAAAPPDDRGCSIAILDLPVGSSLTLDGHVLRLQRDDFVGIKGIPTSTNDGFHFVVARAAVPQQRQGGGGGAGTVPVGFVIMPATTTDHPKLALVRRYSALTEEVSSDEVDATTVSNLACRMEANQLEPHRMIAYSDIVKDESQAWNDATQFISRQLLTSRNIRHGLKFVPGCYSEDDDEQSIQQQQDDDKDGSSIVYPPIPVLQSASSAAARHSQHAGTKKYLATLTPAQRTALFVQQTNPATAILDSILHKYYHNRWQDLLGDIQLSYLIFLQLHCLGSLEHWRDLVAMLCQVVHLTSHIIPLYTHFLTILSKQVLAIEQDFFEDMETSGDNFLLPSLRQLCQTTAHIPDEHLQAARTQLCRILENRFQGVVSTTTTYMEMDSDEEEDEEDKPVVVSTEEYEASMARASNTTPQQHGQKDQQPQNIRQQYPVLFAAQMDHEDILMTCARALDEKNDVSLVREAAAFLVEEVEPGATYTVS